MSKEPKPLSKQEQIEWLNEIHLLDKPKDIEEAEYWLNKYGEMLAGWKVPLEMIPEARKQKIMERELRSMIWCYKVRAILAAYKGDTKDE